MKKETVLLWFFFLLSVITILCVKFFYSDTPEYWKYGAETGEVLYNLSLAYIASLIFYLIVVAIPERRNKKNIYQNIVRKAYNLSGDGSAIFQALSKEAGYQCDADNPTLDDFKEICKKVNPHNQAPLLKDWKTKSYANWIEFLYDRKLRTIRLTETIFTYIPFLDTDFINLVSKVKHCSYIPYLDAILSSMPMKNQDISFMAKEIYEYYMLTRELKIFLDEKLSKYKVG